MMPLGATTLDLTQPQLLTLFVTSIGGFLSLIYWLVKLSFKRQSEITDRYFAHLEHKDTEQQENIKVFGDSMERIGKAMEEQTNLLKGLHEKAVCKFGGKE